MNLTSREIEVLKLLCLTNREIAKRLWLSIKTVKAHVHNIFNKLTCSSRAEALVKAIKDGIINADEVITN